MLHASAQRTFWSSESLQALPEQAGNRRCWWKSCCRETLPCSAGVTWFSTSARSMAIETSDFISAASIFTSYGRNISSFQRILQNVGTVTGKTPIDSGPENKPLHTLQLITSCLHFQLMLTIQLEDTDFYYSQLFYRKLEKFLLIQKSLSLLWKNK